MAELSFLVLRNARVDVINLLKAFEAKNSLRFADFCEVWKNAKFSLIFRDKRKIKELREFIEELFHMTKEYLLPSYKFPIRIGALYTLYGLYNKQPLKDPVKIRLVKTEWDGLVKLSEQCKQEKHYDVSFIHLKLFINQAYLFTAAPRETGFEFAYRKYFRRKNVSILHRIPSADSINKPLVEHNLLENLDKLISEYCKAKTEAVKTVNGEDPKLINENFVKLFRKKSESLGKILQNPAGVVIDERTNNSRNNVESDVESESDSNTNSLKISIGKKRRKIKKRAGVSREKAVAPEQGKISLSPVRKKSRVSNYLALTKKRAEVLLKMQGLDPDNLGPSTSSVAYDDRELPLL